MGLTTRLTAFSVRNVPLGSNSALSVEVAVLARGSHTKVVLAESPASRSAKVFPTYFELVANSLRVELVCLRKLPAPLQWFHYQEASAGAPACLHEVDLAATSWPYALGLWRAPSPVDVDDIERHILAEAPPDRNLA